MFKSIENEKYFQRLPLKDRLTIYELATGIQSHKIKEVLEHIGFERLLTLLYSKVFASISVFLPLCPFVSVFVLTLSSFLLFCFCLSFLFFYSILCFPLFVFVCFTHYICSKKYELLIVTGQLFVRVSVVFFLCLFVCCCCLNCNAIDMIWYSPVKTSN